MVTMQTRREPIRRRKYVCSECDREVGADNLVVKQVAYRTIGGVRVTLKTRAVAWLCVLPADDGGPSCRDKDPYWDQEAFTEAPGNADTRAAKEKSSGR